MPMGRRCPLGCESWPDSDEYKTCPNCGEATKRYRNLQPLEDELAVSRHNHILFEEYYARYCLERGISVEGPLPDGYADQHRKHAESLVPADARPSS